MWLRGRDWRPRLNHRTVTKMINKTICACFLIYKMATVPFAATHGDTKCWPIICTCFLRHHSSRSQVPSLWRNITSFYKADEGQGGGKAGVGSLTITISKEHRTLGVTGFRGRSALRV